MTVWLTNTVERMLDFSSILNASIAASWMVLAVIVVRFILKKAPKWTRVALWGLVAVRLLLPFSIESPLSLIPSTQTVPHEVLKYEGIQLYEPARLNVISNPIFSGDVSIELGQTVDRVQLHMVEMTFVWIVGIIVLMIYTAISCLCLRRKVSTAIIYKDNIYRSENVSSPFVLGIIKPRIYLPFKMDGQNLEYVVSHEKAHIRRKDHLWKPLGFLLLTIHWFNPLMWLAYVLLCRDIELACDEKVIKQLDNEKRADYTGALVACSINRRIIAACPLAFGEVDVKERVKSVMNYKKPSFWIIVLAVASCIAVAACFLTNPPSDNFVEGKTYVYENEGLLGEFSITLYEDGTFTYSEGAASSYLGVGVWYQQGNVITLADDDRVGFPLVNHFRFDGDDLVFVPKDSTNFIYIQVKSGECFTYTEEVSKS